MNHLVVMAKAPRLGRVKTRLARDIGTVAAWAFYRTTLAALLRHLRDRRWRGWLAVTPDTAVRGPWPRGWTAIPQGPGDLGTRMLRPMRTLAPGPVVVVGSDIPALDRRPIAAAFRALGRHDTVFGPAGDGGYWLVGVRRRPRLPRSLFDGVRWSTAHALADTLARADRQGHTAALVTTLDDVDDGAAWTRWRTRSRPVTRSGVVTPAGSG